MYTCMYVGKGQMGSALTGSLQFSRFFDGDFLGTPVNLFLYSQKCQGVPFPQPAKNQCFCSGPIRADPICLQPSAERTARDGTGDG